jgi:hypothetical protein
MSDMIDRKSPTRHLSAAAVASIASFGALLGGCLSVPDGPAPMCKTTDDCDQAHGEVCEEGVCWGNPPPGPFAAVISPPSTRHDLVPRELPEVVIPDFGWMGDLALEAPVLLNGRIVAFCPAPMTGCDLTTLGATVTVSRRSQFRGGPGFKTVVNVDSGAESFSIPMPRTRLGDDPYTVTIVPAGGQQAGDRSPAELVPPLRMQLSIDANVTKTITLGGLELPVISGTLTNSLGQGLSGYRVAALGRWDYAPAPTEVSSVAFTGATGAFAVTLSDGLVGTVELVAQPPDGTVAATVHVANVDATKPSLWNIVAPSNLGAPITLEVSVTGVDRSGMVSPVRGAQVSVTGMYAKSPATFTIADTQLVGDSGKVTLNLLDGTGIAGSYRLSITPPASSPLGALFDQKVTLGQSAEIRLAPRIALRGKIIDSDGKPLTNVTVTAQPSLRFLWTLDTAPQTFVAAIPRATAVTPETGEFVVWVDANVAQVWGHYDLQIEPPTTALAPTYVKADVEIPNVDMLDAVTLGDITLPDAAFVHGRVTGPTGEPVENAELKLYLVSTELSLCSEVPHAPPSCLIPPQLLGRNTSDAKGAVRLVLPR